VALFQKRYKVNTSWSIIEVKTVFQDDTSIVALTGALQEAHVFVQVSVVQ